MPQGRVKWFNNAKGYGFIVPETGGDDLFVHYSSVQSDGYRTLRAGQRVRYELRQGAKGWHAVGIEAVDPPGPPPREAARADDTVPDPAAIGTEPERASLDTARA